MEADIKLEGFVCDREYRCGNSKIYLMFARNTQEENDMVVERVKEILIDTARRRL